MFENIFDIHFPDCYDLNSKIYYSVYIYSLSELIGNTFMCTFCLIENTNNCPCLHLFIIKYCF